MISSSSCIRRDSLRFWWILVESLGFRNKRINLNISIPLLLELKVCTVKLKLKIQLCDRIARRKSSALNLAPHLALWKRNMIISHDINIYMNRLRLCFDALTYVDGTDRLEPSRDTELYPIAPCANKRT